MKKYLLLSFYLLYSVCGTAQLESKEIVAESQAIRTVIDQFFDGMRKGDSSLVKQACDRKMRLTTVASIKGIPRLVDEDFQQFITAIGSPHDKVWNEVILNYKIQIDGVLANVWSDYEFYAGEQYSHCGVDAFQLYKTKEGWKIFSITDTRKNECFVTSKESPSSEKVKPYEHAVNMLIDNWHRAAARGDLNSFFGFMDHDFIYLGTDQSERWDKEAFLKFCEPHFGKDKPAWDFKPRDRHLYFSEDFQYCWFEEKLDTWMGICRGSGVLHFTQNGWLLKHYNLSVTIDNDKIKPFIELSKQR